ncbi:AAA family ATPase [Amycolatopsis thailandensis]|uniref:AAA family ATPase n=1 Tax=Amycolatopsis thailandensis TaxID=589330 RepID=UPI00363952AD
MAEHQQLTAIEIENFTSIRSANVDLGPLNVLIGANGAGKSNLIQAIALLGSIGKGALSSFVEVRGGASCMSNNSDDQRITLSLAVPPFTYQACLAATPNGKMIFDDEVLSCHRTGQQPWIRSLGQGHRESLLSAPVDEPEVASAASQIRNIVHGCRVYHFHDTGTPVKSLTPATDNLTLQTDAGNIAAVLMRLRDSTQPAERAAYRRIVGSVRLIAPFFRDFVLQPNNSNRILLRWRGHTSDAVYSGHQLSNGTLRFACLATLLLQPELPALIAIDEPELSLHPLAVGQLADLLSSASTRSRVLIATQSVTLLNHFTAEDIIVTELHDDSSAFARPNTDALRNWLTEYSLGDLWEKNIIGGHPGSPGSISNPLP